MSQDYMESLDVTSAADDFPKKNQNNQNNWDNGDKTVPLDVNGGNGQMNRGGYDAWQQGQNAGWGQRGQQRMTRNEEMTEISLPGSVKMDPAVGWMVCVDGVDKGRSFRLVKGNNAIGRAGNGKTYAVELTDQAISRKGAASVIVYNEKTNQFFITPGDLTANINPYLNDEILLSPKPLTQRSTLEIAGDILIFVPFCCDKFKWKFEETEQPKPETPSMESKGRAKKPEIVRCERGHYYNSSMHDSCPYCEAMMNENDPDGATKMF